MRAATLLLASCLAGCAASPQPVSVPDLAGTWRNADGAMLTCEDTGVVVRQPAGSKQRPVIGAYTFDGTSATFRDQAGAGGCGDKVGTYTLRVRGESLDAVAVRDACDERRKTLEGAWTRVSKGQVTPDA